MPAQNSRLLANRKLAPIEVLLGCLVVASGLSLLLSKQAQKLLRALGWQRHQVRIVPVLIAPIVQQRALRGNRKPSLIHSQEELQNFTGLISPRPRPNVLHLDQHGGPLVAAKQFDSPM